MDKPTYQSPPESVWTGRQEPHSNQRFYEFVQCIDKDKLEQVDLKNSIVLLGFACDIGVARNQGRIGAAKGPDAIRKELANLAFHPKSNKSLKIVDLGNILTVDDDLEGAQEHLAKMVALIVGKGGIPLVLGGGHETAWGHFQGLAQNCEPSNIAIINFDAHFDMRPLINQNLGSSGTPFMQVWQSLLSKNQNFNYYCIGIKSQSNTQSLFDTAQKANVQYLSCDQCFINPKGIDEFVDVILEKQTHIYLTICLDVFSSAVAKGVSASSPYGLMPWQVFPSLVKLAQSQKIIGMDIVEYAPNLDTDLQTGKLAASIALQLINHFKINNQK